MMAPLADLPLELVTAIAYELDAVDVRALSTTSISLRSALSQREVWKNALHKTCDVFDIFEPSYHPIKDLDDKTLRRCALEPWIHHRRVGRLRSHTDIEPGSHASPVFQSYYALGGGSAHDSFSKVRVVTGGRYVIGVCDTSLWLWNLGDVGSNKRTADRPFSRKSGNAHAVLLDKRSLNVGHPETHKYVGVSEPAICKRKYLRFVAYALPMSGSNQEDDSGAKFLVYEVVPLPASGALRVLGCLRLGPDWGIVDFELSAYWTFGDCVILYVDSIIVMWNFIESELVSWAAQRGLLRRSIVIVDDVIVWCTHEHIMTAKLPPLQHFERDTMLLNSGHGTNRIQLDPQSKTPWNNRWKRASDPSTRSIFPGCRYYTLADLRSSSLKPGISFSVVTSVTRPHDHWHDVIVEQHAFTLPLCDNEHTSIAKQGDALTGTVASPVVFRFTALNRSEPHPAIPLYHLPLNYFHARSLHRDGTCIVVSQTLDQDSMQIGVCGPEHHGDEGHIDGIGAAATGGDIQAQVGRYEFRRKTPILATSRLCLASGCFAYVCKTGFGDQEEPS